MKIQTENFFGILISTRLWYLLILKSVVYDIHENCSNLSKKVLLVNSEVVVDLKNIERPVHVIYKLLLYMYSRPSH
jgi:hypothetical protein